MSGQAERIQSLGESLGKRTPFIGNKSVRIASSALVAILFIFITGAMWTSFSVMIQLFVLDNENDSYDTLENDKKYKEWKRTLESSLGLCGAVIITIVILLVLYFLYLETDFEFSERLSLNLATATQGPDRLRKVAGLLTNYVYPPGSVSNSVRNSLANQFIVRLRQAYTKHNDIQPLAPDEYDNMMKMRTESGGGWGGKFYPGAQQPTSDEYAKMRQMAVEAAGPNSSFAEQNAIFEQMVNEYNGRLGQLASGKYVSNMGDMSDNQRMQEMMNTASGRMYTEKANARNAASLAAAKQEQDEAMRNLQYHQAEYTENQGNLAAAKAHVDNLQSFENPEDRAGLPDAARALAMHKAHAGQINTDLQSAQDRLDMANRKLQNTAS